MPEMVKELGVPRGTVYSILKAEKNRDKLKVIEIGGKKRITSRHRKQVRPVMLRH